jgi:GNAT superfamily N-acetyltransferase
MQPSVIGSLLKFSDMARWRARSGMRLRALRPDDRARMKAFLLRCSAASIRARFFRPINEFSEALLDQMMAADGRRQLVLIVTRGAGEDEEIVAEGRAIAHQDRPHVGDVAFLVQDDLQRRGIATWLLYELRALACRNGFTHFSADVLTDNHAMLALLRKTGRQRQSTVSYGVIHYEIPIACGAGYGLRKAA